MIIKLFMQLEAEESQGRGVRENLSHINFQTNQKMTQEGLYEK